MRIENQSGQTIYVSLAQDIGTMHQTKAQGYLAIGSGQIVKLANFETVIFCDPPGEKKE